MYTASLTGNYWIDPNGGCSADAIEVFCDMDHEGATCIKAAKSQVTYINFRIEQVISLVLFKDH